MNTQVRYSFHSSYAEGELCREAQGHGWLISAFVLCALVMSFSCFADDRTMADDIQAADTTYKFVDERPAGIQQEQFARNLKVTGWKVGDGVYFGQAHIANSRGFGFLFKHGKTLYGVNHRGIQVTRYF
ncbi:MAG: hypothetical protein KDI19_12485 [Pseudomonadales bacterium]|nr:hypothetical protein [Pseudomonadales bacterium]